MNSFYRNVIKIFNVQVTPKYYLPWQRNNQEVHSSSGFIIDVIRNGLKLKRILTNAHSVTSSTSLRVQKQGSTTKFIATIEVIGHYCDLALINVIEPTFWEDMISLPLDEAIPNLQQPCIVIGYPLGGDSLSITKGIVSRVEVVTYAHSNEQLLACQTDSPINAGNLFPTINTSFISRQLFYTIIFAPNIFHY